MTNKKLKQANIGMNMLVTAVVKKNHELLCKIFVALTLLRLERQNGKGTYSVTKSKEIWARVSDIGVTTKLSAEAAGRSAELQAYCHRKEAEGFTHAEYKGQRYRIDSTGAADNSRHIRLILSRGQ